MFHCFVKAVLTFLFIYQSKCWDIGWNVFGSNQNSKIQLGPLVERNIHTVVNRILRLMNRFRGVIH